MKTANKNLYILFVSFLSTLTSNASAGVGTSQIPNYKTESPDWYAECTYSWDSKGGETSYEGKAGLREYDSQGRYKQVTVKQSNDGTCEGTYGTGYKMKNDKNEKDWDSNWQSSSRDKSKKSDQHQKDWDSNWQSNSRDRSNKKNDTDYRREH